MREVLAGVARVPQPSPQINEGGDCFACAIAAVVNHLCPRHKPLGPREAWELFEGKDTGGNRITNNTFHGMEEALKRATYDLGRPLEFQRVLSHTPQYASGRLSGGYTWPWQEAGTFYAEHLEAWLSAGWVALTTVDFAGAGPFDSKLRIRGGDHFLVLDGTRLGWDPPGELPSVYAGWVHVVCSAAGERWQYAGEFQRGHGGFEWLLVRRDQR